MAKKSKVHKYLLSNSRSKMTRSSCPKLTWRKKPTKIKCRMLKMSPRSNSSPSFKPKGYRRLSPSRKFLKADATKVQFQRVTSRIKKKMKALSKNNDVCDVYKTLSTSQVIRSTHIFVLLVNVNRSFHDFSNGA